MKALQILMLMAAMIALASSAAAGEDFGDIENIDFEKVMNNEASWRTIYECLMDKAPCGDFQKLRATFPQIVETKCEQCTPKQKEKLEQIVQIAAVKYPKEFQEITDRYKPKSVSTKPSDHFELRNKIVSIGAGGFE
ncbi:uncharacterized protein LOC113230857 [Hyposmocoma kahamanoa]|uniref:uncharacterized protein LOC113230857 n=1 Tax=Hyposmocoma kahamanoa TaxID=1477025 RepID=UPI000E6D94EB|nr:uncharacterized protein LOC113230857 [Hyposmocoma kahamanoa]